MQASFNKKWLGMNNDRSVKLMLGGALDGALQKFVLGTAQVMEILELNRLKGLDVKCSWHIA